MAGIIESLLVINSSLHTCSRLLSFFFWMCRTSLCLPGILPDTWDVSKYTDFWFYIFFPACWLDFRTQLIFNKGSIAVISTFGGVVFLPVSDHVLLCWCYSQPCIILYLSMFWFGLIPFCSVWLGSLCWLITASSWPGFHLLQRSILSWFIFGTGFLHYGCLA